MVPGQAIVSGTEERTAMSEQPFNVLVVDDSQIILDTICSFLEVEGYRAIPASGGVEALRLVDREPVDLVILDIRMPGLSGLDVLKTLRQSHSQDDLPVIMATALDESDDMVKAFQGGANDYVTKPLDFPVILARIQTRLRSKLPAGVRAEPQEIPWADVVLGTVLEAKYRLESKIGEGQFGVVYRATHLELERQVAVKMLRTGSRNEEDMRQRFRQEGMSTCRLQHPNAVSVLDMSFTPAGIPYLVMELLEGQSLDRELGREGRLSPTRCAEVLAPVCEVLAEAHALGIIHRDIKPQNIFLHQGRRGEVVKILDFGLAKLVGEAVMQDRLTLEGVGPGTPLYMAPERFSELPYDGGADVYSVGVMLYEMLVGQPPFVALDGNPFKVAMMHLYDLPRPIRELCPEVPRRVEEVVLEALAKESGRRPSARELGRRFAAAVATVPVAEDAPLSLDTQKMPRFSLPSAPC